MNEDNYKLKTIARISIVIAIILLLLAIFLVYLKQSENERIRKKIKKLGYEEITNNTFNKKENEINYNYNLKTKDFSKTINTKTQTENTLPI